MPATVAVALSARRLDERRRLGTRVDEQLDIQARILVRELSDDQCVWQPLPMALAALIRSTVPRIWQSRLFAPA
jgi:hypothetical protein